MSRQFKEFKIERILDWQPQIEIDPLKLRDLSIASNTKYPFYGQATINRGIIGHYSLTERVLNNKNSKPTILIHSNNQNIVYLESPFYLKDGHGATSVLQADFLNLKLALYIITAIRKAIETRFNYNAKATKIALKNTYISLPITSNGSIDYAYMEEQISKLEEERISKLESYFKVTGLNDYKLNAEEQTAIEIFNNGDVQWELYNVKNLFGESTRGKRLKSMDRISGNLPFVTAGETDEGISAYIGNNVDIFSKNTSTIDMFGSAKYRNYDYGGDDHVAIVHTENLPKYAAMFVTSALHKAAHAGQFDYSRNFYAKDADELSISLPTKNKQPDFDFMETYIKATQKLVIKDVVNWKDELISKTKCVVEK